MDEDAADENIACNLIPITAFKSNNVQRKDKFIQPVGMMSPGGLMAMERPLSPNAGFCMRDNSFR